MTPALLGTPEVVASAELPRALRRKRFGQRLGRYVLGTLLGSGGAASVYMARLDGPHGFERVLALKVVHEHLLADRDFLAMFLDEANLASELQHPNIVHCYELCQQEAALYLAMEYLQGQPLSHVAQRALQLGQPLPYGLLAWVGARAAEALAYAHTATDKQGEPLGLVHRDVSPDNLFITYDGQVKLLDFGIARATRRLAQTNLGQLKGKLRYMAPEYALGREFDGGLDLFALGATLYEAALGRPAFDGDEQAVVHRILLGQVQDPREIRSDFPEPLWHIIQGTLRADPAARLGPAATVARDLDAAAGLTSAQGRALLAITMGRLFDDERANEEQEIAALRSLSRSSEGATEHGHVLAGRSPGVTSSAFKRWTLAFAVLGIAAVLLLIARPRRPSLAPATTPGASSAQPIAALATSVDIGVVVTPPGISDLEIWIDGANVPPASPHRLVPRGSAPLPVRVLAPGYEAVQVAVIPERDRSLVLALSRAGSAAPAATEKPARTSNSKTLSPPSGVIKRYPF